jgi:hypothetical protein
MYMFMDLIALLVGCFFIVAFIFRWRWPPPDDPAIAVVEEEQSPPYPTN